MSLSKPVVSAHPEEPLVLRKYVVGFVCSIALTLAAYITATRGRLTTGAIVFFLAAFAITQFMVQMIFFLHIGTERKPRWKLMVMCFMLGIVFIVVVGSIWIMNNLNYRMTPEQMNNYLRSQDNL